MCALMAFFLVIFVFLVFLFVKSFITESERILSASLELEKDDYEKLKSEKGSSHDQKSHLAHDVDQIMTLYEISKEITRKYNEEEAFTYFKEKLRKNVPFKECWLVDPQNEKLEKFQDSAEYFLFPLISKGKRFAYLAFEGLAKPDQEKVAILANQFALGLRRVHLYEKIEELATTDHLTGFFTRRHFLERFEEELARAEVKKLELSFLMIDIDHFKQINDTHGHLTGDHVLRGVAKIIRKSIREIDVAGRYGGEEFCVILPETNMAGARFAAERIRTALETTPIKAYDEILKVTLSLGGATYPQDARAMDSLIDKADKALYKAKEEGRNRTFLYKEI